MRHIVDFQKHGVELPRFAEAYVRHMLFNLQVHDPDTQTHCVRVSQMALSLAKNLQLNILDQALCMYSGLLHDVGKIKIPVSVLNKPDKLTQEEYELVKQHTQFGVEIIEQLTVLPFFKKVSDAILYHHERVDGKGYLNLPGKDIPLASKIILVVDTVDAMMEDRAYRKGVGIEAVCNELVRCSGTQFEPYIVDCFLNALKTKSISGLKQAMPAATRQAA